MSLRPPPPPSTPPPPPPPESSASLAHLIRTTLSYDTNVMLAAIISLLLVILFVLLLHLYTRWFLVQARRRSRTSATVPAVLTSRFHQRFTIIDTASSDHSSAKLGLPFSIIASIPLFVYKVPSTEGSDYGSECAICLSLFEEEEIGRRLPGCGHAFHVECIDMWLHSHSTCPICRRAVQSNHNHSRKIDQHLAVEITDSNRNSTDSTLVNEDESQFNVATATGTAISNQILHVRESTVENQNQTEIIGASSSSTTTSSSSAMRESPKSYMNSRSGGKVHPTASDSGDELQV